MCNAHVISESRVLTGIKPYDRRDALLESGARSWFMGYDRLETSGFNVRPVDMLTRHPFADKLQRDSW